MMRDLTDEDFEEAIEKGVTVVDFWSTRCPPCRTMAPVFEAFAAGLPKGVLAAKANVDDCIDSATQLGIMAIPTFVFFKDGKVMEQLVGINTTEQFQSKLEAVK